MNQKIGILGGSFDPIHQGHLGVALCANDQLKLDRVFFVPAARSPFKSENDYAVSDADRLAMTRLAIEPFKTFTVSTWELESGGISYTVDTLHHFKREYPDSEIFLLMGEDAYEGFPHWKNSKEICQLARIVIAPRAEMDSPKSREKGSLDAGGTIGEPIYLKMPLYEASSTRVKYNFKEKQPAAEEFLPEEVRDYIRKHGLYQS